MPAICNLQITNALTGHVPQTLSGVGDPHSLSVQAKFTYGSGGESVRAYLQTSIDGGSTWMDIACFAFTDSSQTVIVNLTAMVPVTTPYGITDGTLSDNTTKDGYLGDRYRVKLTTTGTYVAPTSLKVDIYYRD